MNIVIAVLGRSAVDQPFTELTSSTALVADAPVAVTPAIPPAAAGQELALLVTADDDVKVAVGQWLDPATRPASAPEPFTRNTYIAWAKAPRRVPFDAGNSIVLARPGAAA